MAFKDILNKKVPEEVRASDDYKLLIDLVKKNKISDLVKLRYFLDDEIQARSEFLKQKKKEGAVFKRRKKTQELEGLNKCLDLYKRYLE
ncbi:hypothetical protein KY330_05915 [Candidatus Woesearchaeota archaeon]|nr:hypothetical protein [Candidatus Woesearchaeota archaeon]